MRLPFNISISVIVMGLVALATLISQGRKVGFERGNHGWVSSHVLAIAQKASPSHGFVGYTCATENEAGVNEKVYFDRYPPLFSAVAHTLLMPFEGSLARYIYAARQIMNLIFLLTLWMAWLVLREILRDERKALIGTLFALSGYYFIFYKDMFHFDQPALLGMLWFFYALLRHDRNPNSKQIYWASALAPLMGRGYATLFGLALWVFIDVARAVRTRAGLGFWIRHSVALRCLLVGVILSGSALAYNIVFEAQVREVSIAETSIVRSAKARLGFDKGFDQEVQEQISWPTFAGNQASRLYQGFTPFVFSRLINEGNPLQSGLSLVLWLSFLTLLGVWGGLSFRSYWKALCEFSIGPLAVMGLTGLLWLFTMKRLAAFHDYTTMYYLGFYLLVVGIFVIRLTGRWISLGLIVASALFASSLALNWRVSSQIARSVNSTTYDLIEAKSLITGDKVYIAGGYSKLIPGAPYAPCLYFGDLVLTEARDQSNFVITAETEWKDKSLTPQNRNYFLVRASDYFAAPSK